VFGFIHDISDDAERKPKASFTARKTAMINRELPRRAASINIRAVKTFLRINTV